MSAPAVTAQAWIAAVVGCAAIVDDVTRRRISNWIPLAAFCSGMLVQSLDSGWRGSLSSLFGTIVGGAALLIFYVMGGLGGGDIKLLAGFGAVLGSMQILEAALWTGACGGLIAVGAILVTSLRRAWKQRAGALQRTAADQTAESAKSIPYAPAIALGVWLTLASQASGVAA